MDDYTQKECNYERDKALTECLKLVIGLASRLEPMAAGDATWPAILVSNSTTRPSIRIP